MRKNQNTKVVVAADIMSLAIIKPPGEFEIDVVVGSTQRFGVPMGYGGPHAAFFATKSEYKRNIPGRIIGITKDKLGRNRTNLGKAKKQLGNTWEKLRNN